MNKKIILGILVCAVCICFCGCEMMPTLSEKDTEAISSYSAKMVAKYNTKQKDGVVYIDDSDKKKVEEDAKAKAEKEAKANSTQATTNSSSSKSGDKQAQQQTPPVPLATALGIAGVDIKYTGNEVKDNYTTAIYDMSPATGNKFLVMKFVMTNTSGADVPIDVISKNPKFKATINGATTASNEMTLMPEDLSTYKGTLKPNESKELVLLFQFKSDILANIQSAALQCIVNGSTNNITL